MEGSNGGATGMGMEGSNGGVKEGVKSSVCMMSVMVSAFCEWGDALGCEWECDEV